MKKTLLAIIIGCAALASLSAIENIPLGGRPVACSIRKSVVISWTAEIGKYYLVECSRDQGRTWLPMIGRAAVTTDEVQVAYTDQTNSEFFRVREYPSSPFRP